MTLRENCSLLSYNTFGIDVPARYFVEYSSVEELMSLLNSELLVDNSFYSIGGGSNLLFTKPFDGVILHSKITGYEVIKEDEKEVVVKVGAGVVWDDFVAYCVEKKWHGIENLSLIPGEVGASPVQNIGAYGVEAKDVIELVIGVDIDNVSTKEFSNADCCFGYRDSIFKHVLKDKFIVTHVIYKLSKTENYTLDYGTVRDELAKTGVINLYTVRQAIISIREAKLPDPKVQGNAGSFFKNPVVSKMRFAELQKEYPSMPFYTVSETEIKIPAGWLIEQAGWKGKSHGNAAVHDKQALVLVNKGNVTGKEVVELSDLICQSVESKFDIEISPEVIIL